MASVTGMTAEAIDERLAAMVVSLRVSDTGRLIYKDKSGTETDAGPIVAPAIASEKAYPIGSIYINVLPTDPHDMIGIGTWARFGKGRVLISQDDADTDFANAQDVGGAKTVLLTAAESGVQAHDHNVSGTTDGHTVTGAFTNVEASTNPDDPGSIYRGATASRNTVPIDTSNHTHPFTATTDESSADATEPHDNLPPYIVVYIWRRTA